MVWVVMLRTGMCLNAVLRCGLFCHGLRPLPPAPLSENGPWKSEVMRSGRRREAVSGPVCFSTLTLRICVRGAAELQKCGQSLVFLDPDPTDLRERCRRISGMWQLSCVFAP
eukprot:3530056-Pyramimonas_sp.AAC.1